MLKRTITGLLLLAVVCICLWLSIYSRLSIDLLICVFAILASYEMCNSFRSAKVYVFTPIVMLFSVAAYPIFYFFGVLGLFIEFLAAALIALTAFTFSDTYEPKNAENYNPFDENNRSPKTKTIHDLTATVFIMVYPFLFIASAFELTREYGALWVALMAIFLPIAADTFAYFVGSTVGGKKLCPKISPKKTVAGGIGALIGGLLAGIVFFLLFEYFNVIPVDYIEMSQNKILSGFAYALLGLLGAVVGLLGDLAASKIKRQLGIKDFGNIFPGHGGAVDRIDSILYTLVMLFVALPIIY